MFPRLARATLLAIALFCLGTAAAHGSKPDAPALGALLARAEADKTTDHAKFLTILEKLDREKDKLSSAQRWHLGYLNAWQDVNAGNYNKAILTLDRIINHSGNMTFIVRASGLKINILSRQKQYGKAYELANNLISDLPVITNRRARVEALNQIIQMLSFAGQYDQARQYIKRLQSQPASGTIRCKTGSYALNALYMANRLSSTNPQLKKIIGLCLATRQAIFAHTLQLDKAYMQIVEGHANQAISYLNHIAPSILKTKYESHIFSLYSTLAQAYLAQKNYPDAQKEAFAAIAVNLDNDNASELESAYQVLYKVNKKTGHSAAALAYYEKYVKLDKASISDAKTRALAYQMVKQEVTAKKLRLEALTRQNRILQLRQALSRKQAETSRLYIALLLVAILLICFWLYRLKHSQLHFRRMARHDDLTEAFNRQHFLDEAERVLKRLSRDEADACLIILDLDHFKRINDIYGHIVGDEMLKHASEISRRELRASDVFGRLGGEEFGILMPACSSEQGVEIGERIRHALASTPIEINSGELVTVSASFGLTCSDRSGYSLIQLLTDADAALYTAKRRGRNLLIVGKGRRQEPLAGT